VRSIPTHGRVASMIVLVLFLTIVLLAGSLGFRSHQSQTNLPDGADPTFGDHGLVQTDFGGRDEARAIALQQDGKLVVGGSTQRSIGQADFVLARYDSNGALDQGFGQSGLVRTDFAGWADRLHMLAITPDGRITAVGLTAQEHAGFVGAVTDAAKLALARYLPNGSLDPTFGEAGTATMMLAHMHQDPSLLVQADGKIVVLVSSQEPQESWASSRGLLRLEPSGTRDATFGVNGWVAIEDFSPASTTHQAMALQPDGRIVVAGRVTGGPSVFGLARFNPDGTPDLEFGTAGRATTAIDAQANYFAAAVIVQPDGTLIVTGSYIDKPGGLQLALVLWRLQSDGSVDETFGQDGRVVVRDPRGPANALLRVVALQPNGKLLAGGNSQRLRLGIDPATGAARSATPISEDEVTLWRFEPDGTPDSSFGSGGQVNATIGSGGNRWAADLVVQPGAGIVVPVGLQSDFILVRFLNP
jgi:uncharacterized delta-60 repeat protein